MRFKYLKLAVIIQVFLTLMTPLMYGIALAFDDVDLSDKGGENLVWVLYLVEVSLLISLLSRKLWAIICYGLIVVIADIVKLSSNYPQEIGSMYKLAALFGTFELIGIGVVSTIALNLRNRELGQMAEINPKN